MIRKQGKTAIAELKELLTQDKDLPRPMLAEIVRQVLASKMDEAVGAQKGERTANRLGYRSGYCPRTLITRVGKLELKIPQDRQGRFRTEVFERCQRSEKALVAALAEMCESACNNGPPIA